MRNKFFVVLEIIAIIVGVECIFRNSETSARDVGIFCVVAFLALSHLLWKIIVNVERLNERLDRHERKDDSEG